MSFCFPLPAPDNLINICFYLQAEYIPKRSGLPSNQRKGREHRDRPGEAGYREGEGNFVGTAPKWSLPEVFLTRPAKTLTMAAYGF